MFDTPARSLDFAVDKRVIGKMFEWHMISLNNYGVWALKIMFTLANDPNSSEQLPFIR